MSLFHGKKNVLDEREMQELYGIEHRALWGMYLLLCAAIVAQLLMGAQAAQLAGEVIVVAAVSVGLIIAYARKGIWDDDARPSRRGNAVYAAVSAVGVAAVVLGVRGSIGAALMTGAAMFIACYALLTAMMACVRRRQEARSRELEDD
ncbi:MAG: hypothetical protein J6K32_12405 [Clostridia bacterium]|nr:hypothetical protein [Clostridia bacterium]